MIGNFLSCVWYLCLVFFPLVILESRDNLPLLLAFHRNNRTPKSRYKLYYPPLVFLLELLRKEISWDFPVPFFTKFGKRHTLTAGTEFVLYTRFMIFEFHAVFFVPSYPKYKWAIKQKEKKQTFSFWVLFPSSWLNHLNYTEFTSVFTARRVTCVRNDIFTILHTGNQVI
jgi:hypothetical protein